MIYEKEEQAVTEESELHYQLEDIKKVEATIAAACPKSFDGVVYVGSKVVPPSSIVVVVE